MSDSTAVDDAIRREIITYSKRLTDEGLITGTAGNISIRREGGMIITPSGVPYETLSPDDLCLVDNNGNADPKSRLQPSSESFLHLAAYSVDASAQAVVHFHGLHGIAVANTHDALPLAHYYALRLGGAVPVVKYSRFGSGELAETVSTVLSDFPAALMRNHGAVVTGKTLDEAFGRAKLLEWLCQLVTTSASMGTPHVLTSSEADEVAKVYKSREKK